MYKLPYHILLGYPQMFVPYFFSLELTSLELVHNHQWRNHSKCSCLIYLVFDSHLHYSVYHIGHHQEGCPHFHYCLLNLTSNPSILVPHHLNLNDPLVVLCQAFSTIIATHCCQIGSIFDSQLVCVV